MTLGAGATPIPAVPVQPPRYGLIAAAQVNPGGVAELRWQNGVVWEPEQCGSGTRFAIGCLATDEIHPASQAADAGADPFGIAASDECSPFGFGARDYGARARRQLEAIKSYEIANEFWTGSLSAAKGLDNNRALTDSASDTLSNGGMDQLDAFACLESALAKCGKGRRGMIHVTPQYLVRLVTNDTVRFEGGQFLSPLGNIVVADAGYTGSGPGGVAAGATQWAYATGMVQILLAPPWNTPGDLATAQAWAQATDRSVNTVTVWAQTVAAVLWDECCHLAVEVTLPACLIGGAS